MDFMFDTPAPVKTVENSLFLAASRGNLKTVTNILENEPNIDFTKSINGFNSIQIASKKGHIQIIELLLKYASSLVQCRTDNGRTLPMIAAFEGHLHVLTFLLESNEQSESQHELAEPFIKSADVAGNSVLHYAAWGGSAECVKYLVETCRHPIDFRNNENISPLQFASAGNHVEIVSYLMSVQQVLQSDVSGGGDVSEDVEANGVVVHGDESFSGVTSLHRAASYNALDTIKLLINNSKNNNKPIDINQKTSNGSTALHLATKHGYSAIVHYLVEECHAEVDVANDYGLTALHFACIGGYKDLVQYFLSRGASVLLTNSVGEDALLIAAAHGKHDICRLIADQSGVDLFKKDREGNTPIDKALSSGFKELAKNIALWSCIDLKKKDLLRMVEG